MKLKEEMQFQAGGRAGGLSLLSLLGSQLFLPASIHRAYKLDLVMQYAIET